MQNAQFPLSTAVTTLSGTDDVSVALLNAQTLNAIPRDPSYPVNAYTYQSNATANFYTITFCLETDTIANYSAGCSNTLTP